MGKIQIHIWNLWNNFLYCTSSNFCSYKFGSYKRSIWRSKRSVLHVLLLFRVLPKGITTIDANASIITIFYRLCVDINW